MEQEEDKKDDSRSRRYLTSRIEVQMVANQLDIKKDSVRQIITEDLNMRKMHKIRAQTA